MGGYFLDCKQFLYLLKILEDTIGLALGDRSKRPAIPAGDWQLLANKIFWPRLNRFLT